MSKELTFQGFIDFVKEKPSSAIIDHSMGWETCAVGDYAREVLGVGPGMDAAEGFAEDILAYKDEKLYNALNEAESTGDFWNYGELKEYLANVGH